MDKESIHEQRENLHIKRLQLHSQRTLEPRHELIDVPQVCDGLHSLCVIYSQSTKNYFPRLLLRIART